MLFNAGKAYVKQLDQGRKYNKLCPVYGLSLVNDEFLKEDKYKNKYYHHYKMLHNEISDEVIEGIELIFVELPKFKPKTFTEKKLRNLWLRFLTEIDENTKDVPQDMLKEQEIKEALEYLHISAFTKEELAYYDKYWDSIRVEKSIKEDEKIKYQAEIKKKDKQIEEERKRVEEERKRAEEEKHRAEGEHKKLVVTIKLLLSSGVDIKTISEQVGISVDEIRKLNE